MRIRTLCREGGRTYHEVLIGDEQVFVGLHDECERYARLHDLKAAREERDAQDVHLRSFLRLFDGPPRRHSA